MEKLFDALRNWGCDLDGALDRFLDNKELLYDFLHRFLNDKSYETLMAAVAVKDYNTAFESSHALKGISGNLGITPLFCASSDATEAFRAKNNELGLSYIPSVEAAYNKYVALVKEYGRQ